MNMTDASEDLCQTFFKNGIIPPDNTLFHDDVFNKTCRIIQGKNEARIIQDISLLIVPSADTSDIWC